MVEIILKSIAKHTFLKLAFNFIIDFEDKKFIEKCDCEMV